MTHTILVPLDGAPLSEHALPWAAELARRANAGVRLVRVHLPPVTVAAEGFVAAYPVIEDAALRDAEQHYFRVLMGRLKDANPGLDVQPRVVELDADGDVADTLARAAAGAELVVMTTHGRGPFTRFWLGSTADEFVRQSPVPVLLLRPDDVTAVDLARRPQVRHVLVPLDGSRLAERILPTAARIGRPAGAAFTLLTVLESGAGRHPEGWNPDAAVGEARGYLDRMAQDLIAGGATVHTAVEAHGSPAEVILGYAGKHPDTVVALATHGRGGLTRLLLGSTADKVIRAAAGPVLVFHPADEKPA